MDGWKMNFLFVVFVVKKLGEFWLVNFGVEFLIEPTRKKRRQVL